MTIANRQKLLYAAAGSAAIGIVLLVFFPFVYWIEGTPGHTSFGLRGVQSAYDSTVTVTEQTSTYVPGSVYWYWISIDTPAYTLPIGGAAVLLALAGGVAGIAARRDTVDPARLRLAMKLALAAIAIGVGGGIAFEAILRIISPRDWWLDVGFYGLVSAGLTTAVLLWIAARGVPAPPRDAPVE